MNKIPSNIAIIGVGLIGGSISLGLKKRLGSKISISGLCNTHKRTKLAQNLGIIDHIISADLSNLNKTDLIIVATPISTTVKILDKLKKKDLNCLVMDISSTKSYIQTNVQKNLNNKLNFIGTHPMAGGEMSGFENADPFLFYNKPWIICPNKKSTTRDLEIIKTLITKLGAIPVVMDAKKHDEITAWSSHIFMAMSSIMIGVCSKQNKWDKISQIASTGFRDTTRLASHNPEMTADIFSTNKKNILQVFDKLTREIDLFSGILKEKDSRILNQYLINSKMIRDSWLTKRFN